MLRRRRQDRPPFGVGVYFCVMNYRISISLLAAILLLVGCAVDAPAPPAVLTGAIDAVRAVHAPDKRVALWEVTPVAAGDTWIVRGRTNLPEAKADLLARLAAADQPVADSIEVLPAAALGARSYGLINLSVANLRSKPKHSAELGTQALLGMPLRVWDVREDWSLVQTPDGYLSWLDAGGLVLLTEAEMRVWETVEKVFYTADFGFAYPTPALTGTPVSDLVAGNVLAVIERTADAVHVRYPDGRTAYVDAVAVRPYTEWAAQPAPDAAALLATADRYTGRPYLWGGTSGKGMDCSGFTKTVFYQHGLTLPRDASQQVHFGELVETDTTLKNLQPGDLLFFGRPATPEKKERIWHVGIYRGDGRMIHAAGSVKVNSLVRGEADFAEDRLSTLMRARRLLGTEVFTGQDLPGGGSGTFR